MKAPIAEVPARVESTPTRKKPFLGLNLICGLLFLVLLGECVKSVSSAVGHPPTDISTPVFYLSIFIGLALFRLPFFVFIYFLWRGYNWARLAMLAGCLLSFVWATTDLLRGHNAYHFTSLLSWIFDWFLCLFLYLFLPIWLNLPGVKAHFKAPKKPPIATP